MEDWGQSTQHTNAVITVDIDALTHQLTSGIHDDCVLLCQPSASSYTTPSWIAWTDHLSGEAFDAHTVRSVVLPSDLWAVGVPFCPVHKSCDLAKLQRDSHVCNTILMWSLCDLGYMSLVMNNSYTWYVSTKWTADMCEYFGWLPPLAPVACLFLAPWLELCEPCVPTNCCHCVPLCCFTGLWDDPCVILHCWWLMMWQMCPSVSWAKVYYNICKIIENQLLWWSWLPWNINMTEYVNNLVCNFGST